MPSSKVTEYRGNPILEMHNSDDCSDERPVRLGLRKVNAVLEHFDDAKKFVKEASKVEQKASADRKKLTNLFN